MPTFTLLFTFLRRGLCSEVQNLGLWVSSEVQILYEIWRIFSFNFYLFTWGSALTSIIWLRGSDLNSRFRAGYG